MLITTPLKSSKDNNSILVSSQKKPLNDNSSFSTSPIKIYCRSIHEINKQNENGWTPIYRSIISNNLEILKELLKLGANPNLTNNIGETTVYLCVDIDNYEALEILLKYNADCNISKKDGTTPLHLATKKKKDKFIKILLENNANPNLKNKLYSQTPMHLAVINKSNEDILLCFKKHGANFFESKDKYDKTPFDYAKGLNDHKYFDLITKIFKIKENKNENEKDEIKDEKENNFENDIKNNILNDNKNDIKNDIKNEIKNDNKNDIKYDIKNNNKYDYKIENKNHYKIDIKNDENDEINNINKNKIDNNNNKILNLNELFKNINISLNNKNNKEDECINNNLEKDKDNIIKNENNNNIEEKEKDNYSNNINKNIKNNIKDINKNSINDDKNNINSTKCNYLFNKPQIYQPKKSIKNNGIKKIKKEENNNNNNIINKKKIINNKYNINDNLSKEEDAYSSPEEELILDSEILNNNKEILTSKGRENKHNLGMGITLTSIDNNFHKSKTEKNINTSISNENHPKLSTLSENELLKNIILDTAKKIKNNMYQNHNNICSLNKNIKKNVSIDNSLSSPINTLKTESDKNKINNKLNSAINNNNSKLLNLENGMPSIKIKNNNNNNSEVKNNKKEKINDMEPLDLMNQVITTNSNLSNDTQEQLINNNFLNSNNFNNTNNNLKRDSDILEYSKSYATNLTNLNNTEENSLTYKNNNINLKSNNNSNKKNEYYKKISYHCLHKNKALNLINNNNCNNFNENNENDEENIDEEESNEIDDIKYNYYNKEIDNDNDNDNDNENKDINSIKYKNITKGNKNYLSTYDNRKYNSILEQKNKNNTINQYRTDSNKNKIEDYQLRNELTPNNNKKYKSNSNSPIPIPFSNSNYATNYNSNTTAYKESNLGNIIRNSSSNTTNNSSMKKYAKKLSILNELENSKYNNQYNLSNIFNQKTNLIMPIKTNTSNELLTNENELSIKIGSPQNIPNNLSSKLHDWLISCDLLCYYNLLIKNKIYNIEEYIDKIKKNQISLKYKNIEDLGIRKPGHIFRFLLKIKIDAGLIEPFIYNVILDKYNRNSLNDIKINSSNNGFGCCCFRENSLKIEKKGLNNNNNENDTYYADNINDIFGFLKKLNLLWLKENFIHNGFDQVEFIMIQMFSEYKFNKEILNEYLHIYNDDDKRKVLKKLFEEKKIICSEYNIEYDIDEEKEILTSRSIEDAPKSNDSCLIF